MLVAYGPGVDDDGLTLSEGKGGRLLLKSQDKKLVAVGTRPVVSDGSAKGRLPLAKRGKAVADVVTKDRRWTAQFEPPTAEELALFDAGGSH